MRESMILESGNLRAKRKKLLRPLARFRTVFERAGVGIALVAPDGGWLRVNDALCQIVGLQPR